MSCFSPLQAWRGAPLPSGKRELVFKDPGGSGLPLKLPCGQCIGCRLERSRQWAMRCVHEASLYEENCFITLTYSESRLPEGGSLCLRDFQDFIRRLRREAVKPVRYFQCGEYGEKLGRPHFHACLFNYDFADKRIWSTREGVRLYRSALLEKLWPFGHSSVGDVTFESAAYVARYVMKKVTGEPAETHYDGKCPEFVTMSRRPGIGRGWFDKFKNDLYPSDYAIVRGRKVKPAKYYDSLYDVVDPVGYSAVKARRVSDGTSIVSFRTKSGRMIKVDDNDSIRLPVKETVLKSRIRNLVRPLEAV